MNAYSEDLRKKKIVEALIEAMGAALPAVSARDALDFFRHCGYRTLAQLLWQML